MKKISLLIFLFVLSFINVKAAEDLAPNAKSAILIENSTGKILYEKNAHDQLPPASMTKLASMLIVMEEIDKNHIKLGDQVTISENAAKMGGSQIFLNVGESYSVSDLLKGVAIASGNDAVVALAEKIAGTEEAFVKLVNKRLKEIGVTNTNFVNAHGLDSENHYSTAKDMALIAHELLKHEDILKFTSIYEEYLEKNDGSKTWLVNTNKLVRFYPGVDGLKTGFTGNAGYCLTATAKKNNFRLISVVMGEDTSQNRSSDTVKMLNYGFNTYKLNTIKNRNEILGKIKVEKGKDNYAEITLLNDATELIKNTDNMEKYSVNIKVDKIKAPVKRGNVIGTADIVDSKGNIIDEVELTVKHNLKKANLFDYLLKNIQTIVRGRIILKN